MTDRASRFELFAVDELEPGQFRSVDIDGRQVLVVRKPDGSLRALLDRCSHLGARLSRGVFDPLAVAEDIGRRELSDAMVMRCPWHGFEFDVDTGRCVADPAHTRVRTYEVSVEDGRAVLHL